MPYAIQRSDKTAEAALRRLAGKQVDRAIAALEGGDGPLGPRVHTARKAVKKLRGLIRLFRAAFPGYGDENAALRDAGRTIARLRDAHVMLAQFDRLAARTGASGAAASGLRAPFLARRDEAEDEAALAAGVGEFLSRFSSLAGRARQWILDDDGFDAVAPGLERTWKAASKALGRATADPDVGHMHGWRRRVKDHWYQARLLHPIWPEMMQPHVEAADRLGQLLGEHHDLALFVDHLAGTERSETPHALAAAARGRLAEIEAAAFPLGSRLFAGPASALTRRWRAWWDVWRG